MKIRIKGDSIRFRLTKSEVEALCTLGEFRERTHLGNAIFYYAVEKTTEPGMRARLSGHTLTLFVSDRLLKGWDHNDVVGFEEVERTGDRPALHLLLEKDFVCLDRREEDQSDNYPNPKLQKEGENML